MRSTAEILKAARLLIDKPEAWTRGRYTDGEGAYCAYGAIIHVVTEGRTANPFLRRGEHLQGLRAANVLKQQIPGYPLTYSSIDQFNDRLTTTHADVLALFDRAITQQETT